MRHRQSDPERRGEPDKGIAARYRCPQACDYFATAFPMEPADESMLSFVFCPRTAIATMAAIKISESTMAYSRAVGPSSSFRNRSTCLIEVLSQSRCQDSDIRQKPPSRYEKQCCLRTPKCDCAQSQHAETIGPKTKVGKRESRIVDDAWYFASLVLVGWAFLPDPKQTGRNAHPTDHF